MRSFFLPFCVLLFFTSHSQQISLENLLDYSFPSQLTAASNKGRIAWVENDKGVRNLFYAQTPDYLPMQLTQYKEDDGQVLSDLGFTPDTAYVVYVRGGAPNRKGEIPNPLSRPKGYQREIHRITLATGEVKNLGEGSAPKISADRIIFKKKNTLWSMDLEGENAAPLFHVRGSIGSFNIAPDQSKIAFENSRGDHSFIGVYHLKSQHLSFLDPGIHEDSNPVWSPTGDKIAFLRQPYEESLLFVPKREGLPFSILVADLSTQNATSVFTADPGSGSVFRSISADNQLLWTAADEIIFPWEKEGWTHLYSIPASGGAPKLLTPGELEVQYLTQSPDKKKIVFNSNQDDIDRQHLWQYTTKLQPLTFGEHLEWAPVIDGAGTIFCLGSSATHPADVFRVSQNERMAITKEINYPSEKLVLPEQVIFTATDGLSIHGQLFLPPNLKRDEKAPGILFFHGGSRRQMLLGFHHRGYYHYMYAMNQYLAAKGYVVLSVNYRSGIGYGMAFREALAYGAGGASEYKDVLAAAKFLQDHPKVDAQRLGLWGGSYGGYLTALGLSKNSDIFKAGVDIHGVYDWNAVIKGFIPAYDPLEKPEFAKLAYDSSPVAFMTGWKSPVLLIHGDDDRNVPFNETVVKARKLKEMGVYFEQLVFPDEVHGFLLHKNWLSAFEASADFFDRKLKVLHGNK
ncbi:MAG: prolyl oligopeptidase family serine peptidase [Bacteroidota bacterium]